MKKTIKTIALLSLTSLIIACKGDAKKTENTTPSATTETSEPENTAFTITLESNDQMQFNKKELKVPVGEAVVLNIKHVDKMAIEVMGHYCVLLVMCFEFNDYASKASGAKDTDDIPEDTSGVILHSALFC